MGEITMTASAIYLLNGEKHSNSLFELLWSVQGMSLASTYKKSMLRMAQHRTHNDMPRRCELARRFVIGKLSNQRTMLQRYNRRQSDVAIAKEVDQIGKLIRTLITLDVHVETVQQLTTGDVGISGTTA